MKSRIISLLLAIFGVFSLFAQTFTNTSAHNFTNSTPFTTTYSVSGVASGDVLREITLRFGDNGIYSGDLRQTTIRLRDPAGNWVNILTPASFSNASFGDADRKHMNITLRDHADLNTPAEYVSATGNTLSNCYPFNYGYWRIPTAGGFSNFSGNSNGTWQLEITCNSAGSFTKKYIQSELVFGEPFEFDNIIVSKPNQSCDDRYCIETGTIYTATNVGYPNGQSNIPLGSTVGCAWNIEQNNAAWFSFIASAPTVELSISGLKRILESVVVLSNDCQNYTLANGGCPSTMHTVGSPNYTRYYKQGYTNGYSQNHGYTITGLTVGQEYILIIDGQGPGSPTSTNFYLEIKSGADDGCCPDIELELTKTDTGCSTNTGTITASASGGEAPYTYSLDGGAEQSGNTFNDLAGGTYTVEVTDANGCTETETITIDTPTPPTLSATPTHTTCGDANGAISISATGGATPLEYSIDGGTTFGSNSSFSNLSAGTYNVVVKDANGCEDNQSVTINDQAGPSITAVTPTHTTCGDANGAISISATGGATPLEYSIDGGTTFGSNSSFSNLSAGTYNVVVKDANGCEDTQSVTINDQAGPSIDNIASTDATCGNDDGTITISAAGGTGTLEYSIDGGATFSSSNIFNALSVGPYNIVVKDANDCEATGTVNISDADGPSITTVETTDPTCGASDGEIVITASGGTGTLEYSIDGGTNFSTDFTFENLSAGTYTIVVKDANGCETTESVVLEDTEGATIDNVSVEQPSCGESNGSIIITATGGTGTLTYSIDGGTNFSADGTFANLAPGTYNIIVRDANGCDATTTAIINPSVDGPSINGVDPTNTSCGDDNGMITVAATGDAQPLTYSLNGGTAQASNSFTDLAPGTYTITVTDDNGCEDEVVVTISSTGDEPSIDNVDTTEPACGEDNGSITITASGGTGNLEYSIDGGATFGTSNTYNDLNAGTYAIIVKDDNGCEVTETVILNSSTGPSIDNFEVTAPACADNCDGTITATVSGGTQPYTYEWFDADNNPVGTNSATLNGVCGGDYYLTVTDAAGNGTGGTGGPGLVFFEDFNSGASGWNLNVVLGSEGDSPNMFVVNDNEGGVAVGGCGVANNGDATLHITSQIFPSAGAAYNAGGLCGFLMCVDTDRQAESPMIDATGHTGLTLNFDFIANGQANIDQATVWYNDGSGWTQLGAALTSPICSNGQGEWTAFSQALPASCDNNPNLQIAIRWVNNDDGVGSDPSVAINNIEINSANSGTGGSTGAACSVTEMVSVVVGDGPSIDNVTTVDPDCGQNDGSLTITASGGTGNLEYSIDGGATFGTSNIFNDLVAGTYNIIVKDENGCEATETISINSADGPTISSVGQSFSYCGENNASLFITASGGTGDLVYSIDGGNTFETSNSFEDLGAGTYNIVVKDESGCESTETVEITDVDGPTISSVGQSFSYCGENNASLFITASGGTGDLIYSIDGGNTFETSNSFEDLGAGTYNIVVKDENGCESTETVEITNVDGPEISSVGQSFSYCGENNASLFILASGGTGDLIYSIDGGNTFETSNSFEDLGAGTYNIIVKDENGCFDSYVATITDSGSPSIDNVVVTESSCGLNNGSITVFASGGAAPYMYIWSPAVSTTATATDLAAGTYTITVMDDNGCTDEVQVTITDSGSDISVTGNVSNESCGNEDGSIEVNASGGNGNYSYAWTPNVSTSSTANDLAAGTYEVIVTDENGCTGVASFTVESSGDFWIAIVPESATINEGNSIGLSVDVEPGTVVDEVIWTPADGLSCTDCLDPTANPTETTTYFVEVISEDGCSTISSITVTVTEPCGDIFVPDHFSPNFDGLNDELCVRGSCIVDFEFTIYNRWGQVVFNTLDKNECWDGRFKEKFVQSGVYAYKLKVKLNSGEEVDDTGSINVVR